MKEYFSPAKINLFLRVMGKRSDGYHNLATAMQVLSFGDTLRFRLSKKDRLQTDHPHLPTDRSNLILKTVDLFRHKTGVNFHVDIELDKCIPLQAGLGGGSSNAATTLWALNELLDKPATRKDLLLWSGELGSDVTVFFSSGLAYCTSRGECIEELPPLSQRSLWLCKPSYGSCTATLFQHVSLEERSTISPEELRRALYAKNPIFYNDLEAPLLRTLPQLHSFKEELLQQTETAYLSGAGTCYFGFGEAPYFPKEEAWTVSTEFIYRSAEEWFQNKNLLPQGR